MHRASLGFPAGDLNSNTLAPPAGCPSGGSRAVPAGVFDTTARSTSPTHRHMDELLKAEVMSREEPAYGLVRVLTGIGLMDLRLPVDAFGLREC
jgi:hypothetical protein